MSNMVINLYIYHQNPVVFLNKIKKKKKIENSDFNYFIMSLLCQVLHI